LHEHRARADASPQLCGGAAPGAKFSGSRLSGDSLNALIVDLETTIAETDPKEQAACFEEIVERLHAIRDGYEAALKKEGIRLPY